MNLKENSSIHGLALQNFFFIVVFTLMPLWFGILSQLFFSEDIVMETFYARGEFFLYNVSLIASTYISYHNVNTGKKLLEGWLSNISVILLIIVSFCYALIITSTETPRIDIVRFISFFILIITLPLFYYSQFVMTKRSPDVSKYRKDEQSRIENKLS